MSSFHHSDVGGVTRYPYTLIYNIKEVVSVIEETYGEVIGKLDAVLQVEE